MSHDTWPHVGGGGGWGGDPVSKVTVASLAECVKSSCVAPVSDKRVCGCVFL